MKVTELNTKRTVLRIIQGGILAVALALALVGIVQPTSINSGGGIV